MIEVDGLVFEYPSVRALDGVSLTISQGAIAALVGPNGAGKTTLLRCMAALERPYAGHVSLDGLDVVKEPRRVHERLGYLPDFYGLYDDLTVRQCLVFAARAHGLAPSAAEEAARAAASRVDLSDRFGAAAETLSRGLRQRLAIAQAIVHRPKVLLLDEPASGLDPQARRALSHLLKALREEGMTLVVSSHILAELEDYCTEMIVIEKGRLVGGRVIRVGTEGEEARTRVRIAVAAPGPAFSAALAGDPAVEVVTEDATSAEVLVAREPEARAALLKRLVDQGIAVAEFALLRRRLEDAYFSEVEDAREGKR